MYKESVQLVPYAWLGSSALKDFMRNSLPIIDPSFRPLRKRTLVFLVIVLSLGSIGLLFIYAMDGILRDMGTVLVSVSIVASALYAVFRMKDYFRKF
jgi:hypothetical protein